MVEGDRLVVYAAEHISFDTPTNARMNVKYPSDKSAESRDILVSCVEIHVKQTNLRGTAYVTAGGINQRYITVVFLGEQTKLFNYVALVWGYRR